jgi:hypothetical protein
MHNGRRRHARLVVHLGGLPKDKWPEVVQWAAFDLLPAVKESLLRCPVPTHIEWFPPPDALPPDDRPPE